MSDWSDFSLFSGDTPDYGSSWDFGGGYDFGGSYGPDLGSYDFGGGFSPSFDTSWLNTYISPNLGMGSLGSPIGSIGGGGGVGGGGTNPLIGGLLGALGPAASLIGALASGGVTGASQPKIPTNAMAQLNAGANALSPFATGASPLQQQQASLLNAIASGQGLAQPYAQAIERAFEPQLGSLYEQATNAGRARGFYDAPATSPAGGAVLGPGLANLQGQIAAAKIAQMNALPGLFQQPINTQAMAGGQWANSMLGAAQQQIGQQQSVPMGAQIGQGLSGLLGGAAAGYNATQQANQQQQFQNSLLSALKYPGYGA